MLAAPGSRRQLLPHPAAEPSRQIVLVEGEPDMLAARSHGLPAIAYPGSSPGRPSGRSGSPVDRSPIVMDADHQGRAAARRIADDLAPQADATIVDIDPERDDGYDLTDWILDGRAERRGLDLGSAVYARSAMA